MLTLAKGFCGGGVCCCFTTEIWPNVSLDFYLPLSVWLPVIWEAVK